MKKRIAMLLACCLLASCAATGETVSTPEASTPAPAASAETPFSPVIPTPTPTPEPVPAPNRGDLTEEQVEQVNRAFSWRENPEYDAYYNFTSDFGPGSFHCEGGRVTEDTALLWSEELYGEGIRQKLTLQKEGEDWYIRSFLQVTVEK